MSSNVVPLSLQHLWRSWNIRGFMLLSLSLQLLLALTAPLRRRTSNKLVILLVWSAFILSDWAAIFAFGLISNAQRGANPVVDNNIMAFWSAFLLIHLGGTDSITAFSLEDNALWLRHLVGLAVQVAVFCYIFLNTLPGNNLVLPTAFIFVAGVNKYAERTRALYLASLENLKKSIFQLSTSGPETDEPRPSGEDQVIAERFFRTFKGLLVDIRPSYTERSMSRDFFLGRTSNQTFKLISLELSLMYGVFYTKFLAVSSRWGMCTRTMAFCSSITALVLFSLADKDNFNKIDVGVSYTLLVGVILLDMDSAIILLNSEWVNPAESNWGFCSSLQSVIFVLLGCVIGILEIPLCVCGVGPALDKPWSETVGAFNLLDYCFKESQRTSEDFVTEKFGIKYLIDELRYKAQNNHEIDLWDYIFDKLHDKAVPIDNPGKAKEVSEAKGELALQKPDVMELDGDNLKDLLTHYVTDLEFDEEILTWHVATEICHQVDGVGNDRKKLLSKVLSDYMLYLLVMQQKMTSAIADIGQIRFRDSCSEVRALWKISKPKDMKELCEKILKETTSHEPAHEASTAGKSVLHNAGQLAKILRQSNNKWEIMSAVWVEILSYTANHCRPDTHARLVCEGGELISFIWLLMAHFGIGPRFP
ncbi:hypothetical protein MLD38_005305 [Melastoma candidum]|uniref:Uncharacterized protein n=1 Tax=Melastoma candidum TaxID=119954 RepID=A0ACB9S8C0_9MYRT|nr:hypothetical protein MLD38_005305 [Melastoma candidum]